MKILIVAFISLTLFVSCAHKHGAGCTGQDCHKTACADCGTTDKKMKPGGCADCDGHAVAPTTSK